MIKRLNSGEEIIVLLRVCFFLKLQCFQFLSIKFQVEAIFELGRVTNILHVLDYAIPCHVPQFYCEKILPLRFIGNKLRINYQYVKYTEAVLVL